MAASDLHRRTLSTVVLWTAVLGILVSGWDIGFGLFVVAAGTLALWEFFTLLEHKGIRSFKKSGAFCGALFLFGSWLILSRRAPFVEPHVFEMVCGLGFLLGILSRQVFDRTQATPVVTMAVTLFGMLYVPWLFNYVSYIKYLPETAGTGQFLILFLLIVTKITDIGAYLVGKNFGRHKLLPEVSPKKTWEGFAGGLAAAVLTSWLLALLLPKQLGAISPQAAPILGLVIAVVSVVGDLAESVVKRDTASKDSGTLIPGIGGALDLIDSILFTAPVLYLYLHLKPGPLP